LQFATATVKMGAQQATHDRYANWHEERDLDMAESTAHRGEHHPSGPSGKVIGAFTPSAVEGLLNALNTAGYTDDRIDVVTGEEVKNLETPFSEGGLRGLVNRFYLSLGQELDEMEELRQHALNGSVLVGVPVDTEEASHRVSEIMHEHNGHEVTHFGRWSVSSH
jgi:hypothetical protein